MQRPLGDVHTYPHTDFIQIHRIDSAGLFDAYVPAMHAYQHICIGMLGQWATESIHTSRA